KKLFPTNRRPSVRPRPFSLRTTFVHHSVLLRARARNEHRKRNSRAVRLRRPVLGSGLGFGYRRYRGRPHLDQKARGRTLSLASLSSPIGLASRHTPSWTPAG